MSEDVLEYAPVVSESDSEWFGYRYLGPGTAVHSKVSKGVKPVNDLDAAAMKHDIAYFNITQAYERGEISREEANKRVEQADWTLANRSFVDFLKASPNMLVQLGKGNYVGTFKEALSMAPSMYTSVAMRVKWLLSRMGFMPVSFAIHKPHWGKSKPGQWDKYGRPSSHPNYRKTAKWDKKNERWIW